MTLSDHIIREITPLTEKDFFYIVDRNKTEFTFPIHRHTECELNFIEHGAGVKRIVGDSSEVIGEYDLVLITGQDLEHVWEQHECTSNRIHEITIQFSPNLFQDNVLYRTPFNSIRKLLERAQCGISFPMETILKVHHLLKRLVEAEHSFMQCRTFWPSSTSSPQRSTTRCSPAPLLPRSISTPRAGVSKRCSNTSTSITKRRFA